MRVLAASVGNDALMQLMQQTKHMKGFASVASVAKNALMQRKAL